jgi:hypothetical protein
VTAIVLLGAASILVLAVGSVVCLRQGFGAGDRRSPRRRVPTDRSGLQLRYRRAGRRPPKRSPDWEPLRVTAGALRDRGLAPWPDAVGVWWPEPLPSGALVCRTCLDHPARRQAAVADRDDTERGLVLLGEGARHRVHRRCALHTRRAL